MKKPTKQSKNNTRKNEVVSDFEKINERNRFYEDGYKFTKIILISVVVLLVFSIAILAIALNKKTNNVYFAADKGGNIIQLVPLNKPNQSDSAVVQFLADALVDTFDFNYHNMKRRLSQSTLKFFTNKGAELLIKALEDNGTFEVVNRKKLFMTLALEHAPIIVKKGLPKNGRHWLWKLQVPAIINYVTESNKISHHVVFTVIVSRKSMIEDALGLGISNIIMVKKG